MDQNALIMLTRTSTDLPLLTRSKPYDEKTKNVLIMKLGADLKTIRKVWLTSGGTDVKSGFARKVGNNILAGWTYNQWPSQVTMVLLDSDLNIISPATKMNAAAMDYLSVHYSYPCLLYTSRCV